MNAQVTTGIFAVSATVLGAVTGFFGQWLREHTQRGMRILDERRERLRGMYAKLVKAAIDIATTIVAHANATTQVISAQGVAGVGSQIVKSRKELDDAAPLLRLEDDKAKEIIDAFDAFLTSAVAYSQASMGVVTQSQSPPHSQPLPAHAKAVEKLLDDLIEKCRKHLSSLS